MRKYAATWANSANDVLPNHNAVNKFVPPNSDVCGNQNVPALLSIDKLASSFSSAEPIRAESKVKHKPIANNA